MYSVKKRITKPGSPREVQISTVLEVLSHCMIQSVPLRDRYNIAIMIVVQQLHLSLGSGTRHPNSVRRNKAPGGRLEIVTSTDVDLRNTQAGKFSGHSWTEC